MWLAHKDQKTPVKVGDRIQDSDGEWFTVTGFQEPHHGGSTGRVHVKADEGWSHSYFPGVFNMKWMDRTDQGDDDE